MWSGAGRTAAVAVAVLLTACGAPPEPLGDAAAIDTDVVAALAPDDAAAAATSVNAFGFDLHRALTDGSDGNVVTSPLSTATMLAMVAAGSAGRTAEEFVEVLRLESPRDQRFAALLREVSATDDVTVAVGNAVWVDDDTELAATYSSYVQQVFGARAEALDLAGADAVDTIDAWVAERTNGRIEEIADELGLPDPDAVVVIANAVYFLGQWSVPFDPADTAPLPFAAPDGRSVTVDMMSAFDGIDGAERAERDGYAVLRLPYGDTGRYGMEVFLPDQDRDLPALLSRLDAAEWADAVGDLGPADELWVQLPRLELEWGQDVGAALRSLGLESVFGDADLTPMIPGRTFLGPVVHKTYVRVDEEGTEAAAVTAGVLLQSAGPSFRVDRPFAFTISDRDTGTVLFLGTVTDPRG